MSSLKYRLSLSLLLCCALSTVAGAQVSRQATSSTPAQLVEEGDKYAGARQYDQAVDAYRQAIKLDPNLAAAYHGLGRVYVNMGRATDALVAMRTAIRLEPDNAIAHVNLGITLENLRRFEEALTELNEAKRLSPQNATIHNEIGNLLNNFLGRTADALVAYQEARRLDPDQAPIQYNVGLALMLLGKAADAVQPLQEALRLDPQYRNARYVLSDVYGRLGRYEEAIDSWTKFLEIVPNGPDALTKRIWNYLYAGGHDREAAADARRYLDVHGWRTQVSTYMVIIAHLGYRGAGMDQEAAAILEEGATKANPSAWPYPIVRYLKGDANAEDLLRQAIDNDKKTEAHAYMGLFLRLKGERDEARTHFQWVKEYGNKRFYEYPLAIEELKRLGR
ncbi:MAG TPA: tetratricopeptide repeat protein [Pyrinomonadaceae bacterium]|nr:tetratricopeptide repeat protein [Pyrinomonadaceae bacterium]